MREATSSDRSRFAVSGLRWVSVHRHGFCVEEGAGNSGQVVEQTERKLHGLAKISCVRSPGDRYGDRDRDRERNGDRQLALTASVHT
eukprot:4119216-Amphidinium_carterae.1